MAELRTSLTGKRKTADRVLSANCFWVVNSGQAKTVLTALGLGSGLA